MVVNKIDIINFYKKKYNNKKIFLVGSQEIIRNKILFNKLIDQIRYVKSNLRITLALKNEDIKFLYGMKGSKNRDILFNNIDYLVDIKNYNELNNIFDKANKDSAFKIIFLKRGKILINGKYYSLLWSKILDRLYRSNQIHYGMYIYFKKIIQLLNNSKYVDRVHFVNINYKKSLFNEIFTLEGATNGNGLVVLKDNSVYTPLIQNFNYFIKLNLFDKNILYKLVKDIFDQNKQYFIKRNINELDFNNLNLIVLEKKIVVGIFELRYINENIYELGTIGIDEYFKGKGMFRNFLEAILDYILSKNITKIIIVTANDNLKYILDKFESDIIKDWKYKKLNIKKITSSEIAKVIGVLDRYNKMVKFNRSDGFKRVMYYLTFE